MTWTETTMQGAPAATATCPACGHAGEVQPVAVPDREYALPMRVAYASCAGCATAFQVPMPGLAELGSFYPADYHSMGGDSKLKQLRHRMRLKGLLGLVPDGATILDYGCGDGSFLRAAAEAAPQGRYFGYEIGAADAREEQMDGKVTLLRGSVEHLLANLPELHLVTMNHVIEHLPDPAALVAALRAKLLPGGVLEGQTPAAGSLEHAVFGTRWSGYHAPRHTVVFSRAGLRTLLEGAGFAHVEVRGAFNPAGLAVSFASLRQGAAGGRIQRGGFGWLFCLGLGALAAPIDLLSGRPGIVDFVARAPGGTA